MPDASVDSIVTDPPYGLSFMGKRWDYDVPSEDIWRECLRALKPGGHLLAFAGTRTQHRMAVRIEDAGFEIRDMIAWVYGSGFPKSLDVSKAIDKAAGAEREVVGHKAVTCGTGEAFGKAVGTGHKGTVVDITVPATPEAQQWQGWGTALKPALEPITVARKPLGEKTVAANVLEHGTGAMNIDGCRVASDTPIPVMKSTGGRKFEQTHTQPNRKNQQVGAQELGRWPANLIHDGSEEVVGLFPVTKSGGGDKHSKTQHGNTFKGIAPISGLRSYQGDSGSAARFFYCAKASKADRDEGCEGIGEKSTCYMATANGTGKPSVTTDDLGRERDRFTSFKRNCHPTVKPTALMRYLCRLVTPLSGTVLDPFMGSGSTGKAAVLEGFNFIGIEREAEYVEIAKARITAAEAKSELPLFAA
jgi:site-specific DNA-methyltransferase (adenine-specific)